MHLSVMIQNIFSVILMYDRNNTTQFGVKPPDTTNQPFNDIHFMETLKPFLIAVLRKFLWK